MREVLDVQGVVLELENRIAFTLYESRDCYPYIARSRLRVGRVREIIFENNIPIWVIVNYYRGNSEVVLSYKLPVTAMDKFNRHFYVCEGICVLPDTLRSA